MRMRKETTWKKLAGALTGVLLLGGVLTGCGAAGSDAQQAQNVTITFMNQEEKLGEAQAAAGEVLDAASYAAYEKVDGAEFAGWYGTPTFLDSSKKDLTSDTFTEDTTLYGDFRVENVTEDTRKWYIAGTSEKGSLKENNWAAELDDAAKAAFELAPTGNLNEFALTIDLFEGDQFQIIPDWSWDGQKGYGLFTEIDDTQMENAGGLSGSADTSNVQAVMDGNYTITLTTNPDNPAQDTLSIVRNSDPLTTP